MSRSDRTPETPTTPKPSTPPASSQAQTPGGSSAAESSQAQTAGGHPAAASTVSSEPAAASAGGASTENATTGTGSLFIDEVQGHQKRYQKLVEFTHSSTRAAAIMLAAAIVALVIANSGAYEAFEHAIHTMVGFVVGDAQATMSIAHVINDLLMALFFLLVGLEIKYEMTVGELTNIRQALLPIIAAIGGVAMPIIIYSTINAGSPETAAGWGVPTATDIAFALGIMSLLGNRIPNGIKVFLSTLAVADDIIAILVIAIFYGESPDPVCLAAAACVVLALVALNRAHIYSLVPYMLLGVVLWVFVYLSGIHATLAGVLLAFTIPSGSRVNLRSFIRWSDKKIRQASEAYEPDVPVMGQQDYMRNVRNLSAISRQVIPPATRLENALYPWVYFLILPLFALTNANVHLSGDIGAIVTSPAFLGVFFGLLLGKPTGIMLASLIVVKTKIASLPSHVNWRHMLGASVLGGVGFTMAIFVANLAYTSEAAVTSAKLAILMASLLAGVLGFTLLALEAKRSAKKGVVYLEVAADGDNVQHDDREQRRDAERMIDEVTEEDREAYANACSDGEWHEIEAHQSR